MLAVPVGFGCWFIYRIEPGSVKLIDQTTQSVAAIGDAAKSAKTAADNLNSVVNAEKPKLAAAMTNLAATTANLETASADAQEIVAAERPQIDAATKSLVSASANVDKATAEFDRKCTGKDDCGTIATAERMLNSVRLAAGQITAVSLKEQDQRILINKQETQLADDAHGAMVKLNTSLTAVSSMATETATAWHNWLHPKWPKRVWDFTTGAGLSALKFVIP